MARTLTDSTGAAINLTGGTVQFRMRPLGSTTLKVDAAATIVTPASGSVSYAWQAADVNTAGLYLAWWVYTTAGGLAQTVLEELVEFRAHGTSPALYVEPEELKALLDMTGTTYADDAILRACNAASRGVDIACERRFWLDANASQVRTYTPNQLRQIQVDDLVVLTSLKVDRTGDTVYEETWTLGTDFILEPQNNPTETPVRPWEWIRARRLRGRWFPVEVEASVQVTGQFGWPAVPEEIHTATAIIASKLLQRIREAPFGLQAVGGPETGIAARIARNDPDVEPIIAYYSRKTPWL